MTAPEPLPKYGPICHIGKPCPVGIEIGLVNQYYDLAHNGNAWAAEHYRGLALHADACVQCGHCNDRCPFQGDQMARMQEISSYFRSFTYHFP